MSCHRCPVCNGSGEVHESLYAKRGEQGIGYVQCRSCAGRGIVFGEPTTVPVAPYVIYPHPQPYTVSVDPYTRPWFDTYPPNTWISEAPGRTLF